MNKAVTAQGTLEKCLELTKRTKCLNAYITLNEESVLKKGAAESDQRKERHQSLGALDGIPIAVKDNFSTAGLRTTCASKMLSNYTPPYTATVVSKLLDKGALLIGKTNLDEFGMGSGSSESFFGPIVNPWKSGLQYKVKFKNNAMLINEKTAELHISGGSSGGSAVAVATGTCLGALSSDTGGSTRNPASHCGILGLKPTYGLLSRHGLIPLTNSMDVPGIMARDVDQLTEILCATMGLDVLDSTSIEPPNEPFKLDEELSVEGLIIGIPKEYELSLLSDDVKDTWKQISDLMAQNKAKVESVSLPHTKYSLPCYSILNCCEVASNFARYDGIQFGHRANQESSTNQLYATTRQEGFNEEVRGRILAGNYFLLKENYNRYFIQAMKVRRLISQDFDEVFKQGIDLLLTPVTLSDAPTFAEWNRKKKEGWEGLSTEDLLTQPANLAGIPALTVPCRLSSKGLPLGLQLIGNHFQEKKILRVAKWLQQRLDFPCLEILNS